MSAKEKQAAAQAAICFSYEWNQKQKKTIYPPGEITQ
jgi:hypothetical protein